MDGPDLSQWFDDGGGSGNPNRDTGVPIAGSSGIADSAGEQLRNSYRIMRVTPITSFGFRWADKLVVLGSGRFASSEPSGIFRDLFRTICIGEVEVKSFRKTGE
jgi:hypothetical protein